MCDWWPFPACQRRGGKDLTHTQKHTSRASRSLCCQGYGYGWVIVEWWWSVNRRWRRKTANTHTLSPLNIDAKSEIYTNKVIINTDARQNSTYYFFSMDTVCIVYVDDLKAVKQTHFCMHPSSYVHRNTHAELRSSACQISDTLREKKAS